MKDTLKDTLSKINEWIKFAEAKNAANIAFCSAAFMALLNNLLDAESINKWAFWYLIFVVLCLVLSLSISLLSFVPKLKAPWQHIGDCDKSDNLLFFGHACKYSAAKYLDTLYNGKKSIDKSDLAYADQIVTNSKIAFFKFKQFDMALWFTITALLTPLGTVIIATMRE